MLVLDKKWVQSRKERERREASDNGPAKRLKRKTARWSALNSPPPFVEVRRDSSVGRTGRLAPVTLTTDQSPFLGGLPREVSLHRHSLPFAILARPALQPEG